MPQIRYPRLNFTKIPDMQVNENFSSVLGSTLVRLDGIQLKQLRNQRLENAIDELGRLSGQNSGSKQPHTSVAKLLQNLDHVLYLSWEFDEASQTSVVNGYAKVCRKHLFLYNKQLESFEGDLLVLLDSFVHPARQRRGLGTALFRFLFDAEHIQPHWLALDNPSQALISFFGKSFGLDPPVWQNTNIVVFQQLFDSLHTNDGFSPEGWRLHQAPRVLNGTQAADASLRYLARAAPGHEVTKSRNAAPQAMAASNNDAVDETLSQRATQARQRKQQLLSSNPLW